MATKDPMVIFTFRWQLKTALQMGAMVFMVFFIPLFGFLFFTRILDLHASLKWSLGVGGVLGIGAFCALFTEYRRNWKRKVQEDEPPASPLP